MKKSILAALALTAILIGCVKDELRNPHGDVIDVDAPVFHAGFVDKTPDTKTYLNEGGHLRWNADDRLTIFVGKTLNTEYAFDGDDGDNAGEFLQVSGGSFATGNPLDANYAVYPYSKSTKISEEGVISLSLPAVQAYGEDSFGRGTNTMVAVTEDTDDYFLPFKNVCGYLVVSLYGDATITSVSLTGNNGEKIAGDATVTPSFGGNPSVAMKDSATETVSIDCGEGVELGTTKETATAFWFCIPQTSFTKGFTITATSDDGAGFQKSTSKAISVERNKIYSMAALKFEANYGNIHFEDPAAKFACVAKFDTDGDGEVSYEEAAAATSFSGLFTNWNTVSSFDEISYFKNVHSLSGVFDGCNKLVCISIPENITNLGTYAFNGCSSLTTVELPSGITAIGNYTFQNCSKLESVNVPASVSSIGYYAFAGCSSLTDVTLPSSLETIASYVFDGCSSLTYVSLPNSLTSIGTHVFQNCTSLATVFLPSGITSIPERTFYNCKQLSEFAIPDGVTEIGDYAFYNCRLFRNGVSKIEIPASVTNIGTKNFTYVRCAIINSSSYVSISDRYAFGNYTKIYVAANKVEAYKVRTNWSSIAKRIFSINDYEDSFCPEGAVDLGLSVYWATCNIGATQPEEYGDYYAWGETEAKTDYSWSTYLDSPDRDGNSFTKYYIGEGGKTVLDPEDDVAHVLLGGKFRIPTHAECIEMIDNCIDEKVMINGVWGELMTSRITGESIFLPRAGDMMGTSFYSKVGNFNCYWSSSLDSEDTDKAYYIQNYLGGDLISKYGWNRSFGLSVRPVSD